LGAKSLSTEHGSAWKTGRGEFFNEKLQDVQRIQAIFSSVTEVQIVVE